MIWNLPNRSVSWIKAIEEMLDVKYKENMIPRPEDKDWHVQINNHGGFGGLNEEDSYRYNMEHDIRGVIERYRSVSVISAAENNEKEALLSNIKKEMKGNPDVKDQEKYKYDYVAKIAWVQKN